MRFKIFYLFFLLLIISSCSEPGILDQRKGYVKFSASVDETVDVVPLRKSAVSDLQMNVSVVNASGDEMMKLDGDAIHDEVVLYTGAYKAIASVGNDGGQAAFDMPFYQGECDFTVRYNVVSNVNVACNLSSTMVTVALAPEIAQHFRYSVEVSNGNASLIYKPEDETIGRTGYFSPTGELTWTLNLENDDRERFTISDRIENVTSAQHYELDFSLEQPAEGSIGEGEFRIVVNDAMNDPEVHDVVLVIDKSAPSFTGNDLIRKYVGVDIPEAVFIVNSSLPYSAFTVSHTDPILAQYGLAYETQVYGVQDLTTISGVDVTMKNGDTDVCLDFAKLMNQLPVGEYTITLIAANESGKALEKDVKLVVDSAIGTFSISPWARFIYVKGQWLTDQKPQAMTVQYKLSSSDQWLSLAESELRVVGTDFKAFILGLSPTSDYDVRVVSAHEASAVKSATTEPEVQLYNNDFEIWSGSGDFYYPYPANPTEQQRIWDNANKGMEQYSSFGIKGNTSRVSGENQSVSGYGVKMQSIYAQIKFAAGNLYTGRFNGLVGTKGADLDWGVPFTSRPLGVSVYYRYSAETINYATSAYADLKGKEKDKCQVLIVLQDVGRPYRILPTTFNGASVNGPTLDENQTFIDLSVHESVIARGVRNYDDTGGKMQKVILPFDYRSTTRIPTHAIVTFSSSYLGDYFTGGEGSTMWVDELNYIYDPLELSEEDREAFFAKFE
jgi:hypothetical protein